jgi:hypothetical protein
MSAAMDTSKTGYRILLALLCLLAVANVGLGRAR